VKQSGKKHDLKKEEHKHDQGKKHEYKENEEKKDSHDHENQGN